MIHVLSACVMKLLVVFRTYLPTALMVGYCNGLDELTR